MNINNLDISDIEACDNCSDQIDISEAYPNNQDGFYCEPCHDALAESEE